MCVCVGGGGGGGGKWRREYFAPSMLFELMMTMRTIQQTSADTAAQRAALQPVILTMMKHESLPCVAWLFETVSNRVLILIGS